MRSCDLDCVAGKNENEINPLLLLLPIDGNSSRFNTTCPALGLFNSMALRQYLTQVASSPWIAAPMVHQSELTFRLLCRRYNVVMANTPMLHSRIFANTPAYRKTEFQTHEEDQPLVAQLASSDPSDLLSAAQHLYGRCDVIDLNFGCPQAIARRGNYGAFLLSDIPKLQSLVSCLAESNGGRVPVSCKIRLLPSHDATIQVVQALVEAGCQMLTVHGRTREQNKQNSGAASWTAVRRVVEYMNECYPEVVVVSNGGVGSLKEARDCVEYTGACGVMAAEALLCNPAMFYDVDLDIDNFEVQQLHEVGRQHTTCNTIGMDVNEVNMSLFNLLVEIRQLALAQEYLELAKVHSQQYLKPVRSHLFKLCHISLCISQNHGVRTIFAKARSLEEMEIGVATLQNNARARSQAALQVEQRREDIAIEILQRLLVDMENNEHECKRSARLAVAAVAIVEKSCHVGHPWEEGKNSSMMPKLWYYRHPREEVEGKEDKKMVYKTVGLYNSTEGTEHVCL